jgi:O-antigen/teichoic acid export membrane protein
MGGDMNELMSTKTCSPMMIYLAVLVTSGLSVYVTRNNLKRHNTVKMDNLYNMYTLNELKFMIVFGIILYGLCQYNKSTLAWVFLIFPVIYLLIQNLIIHIHVS